MCKWDRLVSTLVRNKWQGPHKKRRYSAAHRPAHARMRHAHLYSRYDHDQRCCRRASVHDCRAIASPYYKHNWRKWSEESGWAKVHTTFLLNNKALPHNTAEMKPSRTNTSRFMWVYLWQCLRSCWSSNKLRLIICIYYGWQERLRGCVGDKSLVVGLKLRLRSRFFCLFAECAARFALAKMANWEGSVSKSFRWRKLIADVKEHTILAPHTSQVAGDKPFIKSNHQTYRCRVAAFRQYVCVSRIACLSNLHDVHEYRYGWRYQHNRRFNFKIRRDNSQRCPINEDGCYDPNH